MGASHNSRGLDAIHTHMTNSWNTFLEALEHQFPLRIRRYEIRTGSAGAGRHRGGEGVIREIEFLAPAGVTILNGRRRRGRYGLAGGQAGKPGENSLIANGRKQSVPGKATLTVEAGEVLRIETPGGGGFGPAR